MSDANGERPDDETVKTMAARVEALLSKTVENGCTEEEAASAAVMAEKLIQKYLLNADDLGGTSERKTFVREAVRSRYGNKWRFDMASTVAHNCGVLCVRQRRGRNDADWIINFCGREHVVAAAKMIAEYLIDEIERLSSEYAKISRSGSTGRRQHANAAAVRVMIRVRDSANLASDPRLPVVLQAAKDEAKEHFYPEGGLKMRAARPYKFDSEHAMAGYMDGEHVSLRPQVKPIGST